VVIPESQNIVGLALTTDGKRFALGLVGTSLGTEAEVVQYDESSRDRTWKQMVAESSAEGSLLLTYSRDGSMLVESARRNTFGGSGVMRVREAATGKERQTLSVETPMQAAFDPTGRYVIATLGLFRGYELGVWDLRNPAPPRGWKHSLDSIGGLEVSPCGRLVAMICSTRPSRGIHVWELRTLSSVRAFEYSIPGKVIRFAPE
jgi:hypothetical protein